MYGEYFIAAAERLRQQGLKPSHRSTGVVSEADLDRIDQRTDQPMPAELRRFYIEMGDGFWVFANGDANDPDTMIEGWDPNYLSDYAINNKGFYIHIEDEVSGALHDACVNPDALRQEGERRKKWIPFYGFVGGGDYLCLDAAGKVQYYEALYWRSRLDGGFVVADSFTDFVVKWSKYSFLAPEERDWTSFCFGHSGVFDWSPSHFQYPLTPNQK